MDLWYMFACVGIDFLKHNGNLCFIATNNWVTNGGASKMRNKVLTDSKIIQLVDFGNFMIFESASIQTMVMLFSKNFSEDNYNFDYRKLSGDTTINDATDLLLKRANDKAVYLKPTIIRDQLQDSLLTFNADDNSFVLDKIFDNSVFFTEKEVAQGIVFPQDFLNKKNQAKLGNSFLVGEGIFALTETEKENLCFSSKELDIIKPYYTTEQIKRYCTCQTNNLWVIYTDSHFKKSNSLNEYPNLKKHLDRFSKIITSDNKPYGLHRAREERFFQGEKILVQRKCVERPSFSYANFDCYVSATFYVIKTDRFKYKYLLGLLNSKLIEFWLQNKGKMQGDNFQLDKEPLLNIPIRIPTDEQQNKIVTLVEEILTKKSENCNFQTKVIENEIDKLVFEIYSLLEEDIELIKS